MASHLFSQPHIGSLQARVLHFFLMKNVGVPSFVHGGRHLLSPHRCESGHAEKSEDLLKIKVYCKEPLESSDLLLLTVQVSRRHSVVV